jgi:hypothetical protein
MAEVALDERDFDECRRYLQRARQSGAASAELKERIEILEIRLVTESSGRLTDKLSRVRAEWEMKLAEITSPEEKIEVLQALGNSWIAEGETAKGLAALEEAKKVVNQTADDLSEEYRQPYLAQRRIRELETDLKAAQTRTRVSASTPLNHVY